jgi:hypothetical protein
MAGILDDVMDGIAAKEKQEGTQPSTPPAQTTAPAAPPAQEQATKPAEGEKPMNTYSDTFKGQYGERK